MSSSLSNFLTASILLQGLDLLVKSIIYPHASYPQRSTDMHLLSSPAHLFSIVLLSIVLGVMTMAVPMTARNTDIGKWQWHSKRGDISVNNVMLVRRYGEKSSTDNQPAVARTMMLHIKEQWQLYITRYHGFYAVQENQLWRLTPIGSKKAVLSSFVLGTIDSGRDTYRDKRMEALYSKIQTMTGPNQFAAINAAIQMLSSNEVEGVAYTPTQEDPNAWKEIYMAMTDYAQYEKVFPEGKYSRFPDDTTDAQRTVLITKGLARVKKSGGLGKKPKTEDGEGLARVTGAGGQLGKKSKKQGGGKKLKKQGGNGKRKQGMSSSTDPMRISNVLEKMQ
ncbi:hypothetical protein F5890DRAFT_1479035 [Lentinula detonsa]|uniref:Uncharacterized protein n=1 Tax=Lentinula detonsa TaxID=2804962 RepID=A0AA38PNF0_9AGAR|nr:hypothetical protein F5890DRAFT_1479035 [Lentinula detonsa]